MKLTTTRTGLFLAISALLAPCDAIAQAAQVNPQTQTGTLAVAATDLDAVKVRGVYIPEPMLASSAVMSYVSKEDLSRQGDSTAADALTRVAGLSVADGKFVYVRGLNERYSSALWNGSPLPSPEPLKRVVPLDLFPTNVLETIEVQKTYSARYPGEFGGGVINLTSAAIPEKPFLEIGVGMGGNSETTFQPGLTHYGGGDSDLSGFDNGTRKMPAALKDAIGTGNRIIAGRDFSQEQVRQVARSLVNAPLNLQQTTDSVNPDYNAEISAGNAFDMGGARLGLIATAAIKNGWQTESGVQQSGAIENGTMVVRSGADFISTTNNATVNGLVGAAVQWGEHKVGATTMYVHDTSKETRSTEGYSDAAGFDYRDDNSNWFERELINTQLTGEHAFGEYRDLEVDWRVAHARATREAPYEKSMRYRKDDLGYWAHDAKTVRNRTSFSEVNDRIDSAGVDAKWRLPTERDISVMFGGAWSDNERDAWSREFRLDATSTAPFYFPYQRPDYLLSDYSISQGWLDFIESTPGDGTAAYDASLETRAAYVELETQLTPNVLANLGVRYEEATQKVQPVDLFNRDRVLDTAAPLENDYFLPALTVTWNFAENMQLRFGASQTIARPQFRELAPQQYLDLDLDRLLIGNPYLVDSELTNLDVRFEWYFNQGEYFSAGLFYKDIDKPIEAVLNESTSLLQQSFINAPSATIHGVELDFRKYFASPFHWTGDNRFFVSANYTWSDSKVQVKDGDLAYTRAGRGLPQSAADLVADGSRMQGQSEHLANVQFGLENPETGSQATILVGYASERITARGTQVQPDFMFEPGTMVDFVLRKAVKLWDADVTLSLEARNVLGEEYHEYQEMGGGRADVNRYDLGTSYAFKISTSF